MPRLVPDLPLPSYAFVPGGPFPRPMHTAEDPERCDPPAWQSLRPYLFGIDLFNHGFYWEAHEAWEGLWHAAGRRGGTATFLKGLIKLAAAGVKVREGLSQGVTGHARRAAELFEQARRECELKNGRFMGLDLSALGLQARALVERPPATAADREEPVAVVFGFVLVPAE